MGRTKTLQHPRQFGKYQLIAEIGQSRMGTVYKAKILGVEGFEKIVRMKTIHLGFCQEENIIQPLISETQRIVSLSHVNIAQIYDLGQEPSFGQYYIASEFVLGFDLSRSSKLLKKTGTKIPIEIYARIISEVAKALDYAHRRKDYNFNTLNIAHLNLSPENILLSFDGEVKVNDFGIWNAKRQLAALSDEDEILRLKYSAPEIFSGEVGSLKSDIFSLGLIFYELVTGHHPYDLSSVEALRQSAFAAQIRSVQEFDEVPRALATIIDAMLVRNPEGRPESAADIFEDLIAYIYSSPERTDAKTISLFMQKLRRSERSVDNAITSSTLDEISMADIRILTDETMTGPNPVDRTQGQLPTHKLKEAFSTSQPNLPGSLEDFFLSVRSGKGKAVIVSGNFGGGRTYLPDRLVDALGWRGNTMAYLANLSRDDAFIPLSTLGNALRKIAGIQKGHDFSPFFKKCGLMEEERKLLQSFHSFSHRTHSTLPTLSAAQRIERLGAALLKIFRTLSTQGPLVIVFDQMDNIDIVSRQVLRLVVEGIKDMSLMLVMFSSKPDATREWFDRGNPEALKSLHVSGNEAPNLNDLAVLPPLQTRILSVIALNGRCIDQGEITRIISRHSSKDVLRTLRELTDLSYLRIPEPGVFAPGIAYLETWPSTVKSKATREDAETMTRFSIYRDEKGAKLNPTLIRFLLKSGDRNQFSKFVQHYIWWLKKEGWTDIALLFFDHALSLLADYAEPTDSLIISLLISRAELALDMSRMKETQSALEPINVLTQNRRDIRNQIRGILLSGRLAMRKDDLEDAKGFFEHALEAADIIKDASLLSDALVAFAGWKHRSGQRLQSKSFIQRALHINQELNEKISPTQHAYALNLATRISAAEGTHGMAQQHLQNFESIVHRHPEPLILCLHLWAKADLAFSQTNYEASCEYLREALKLTERFGLKALEIDLLGRQSMTLLKYKRFDQVFEVADTLLKAGQEHQEMRSIQLARSCRAAANCMTAQNPAAINELLLDLQRAQKRGIPKDIYQSHQLLEDSFNALGKDEQGEKHFKAAQFLSQKYKFSLPFDRLRK